MFCFKGTSVDGKPTTVCVEKDALSARGNKSHKKHHRNHPGSPVFGIWVFFLVLLLIYCCSSQYRERRYSCSRNRRHDGISCEDTDFEECGVSYPYPTDRRNRYQTPMCTTQCPTTTQTTLAPDVDPPPAPDFEAELGALRNQVLVTAQSVSRLQNAGR